MIHGRTSGGQAEIIVALDERSLDDLRLSMERGCAHLSEVGLRGRFRGGVIGVRTAILCDLLLRWRVEWRSWRGFSTGLMWRRVEA